MHPADLLENFQSLREENRRMKQLDLGNLVKFSLVAVLFLGITTAASADTPEIGVFGHGDSDNTFNTYNMETGSGTDTGISGYTWGEACDIDGDGYQNVPVRDTDNNFIIIDLSNNSVTDTGYQTQTPGSCNDYDGDGKLEIWFRDDSDNNYLKAYEPATSSIDESTTLAVGFDGLGGDNDYDDDGNIEIVYQEDSNGDVVVYEPATGTAEETLTVSSRHRIGSFENADSDNYLEVVLVAEGDDNLLLWEPETGNTETLVSGGASRAGGMGDIDNDGSMEIIFLDDYNDDNQRTAMFYNMEDGTTESFGFSGNLDLTINIWGLNKDPVVNSVSTSPDPWTNGSSINFTVDANDSYGYVQAVNVSVMRSNPNSTETTVVEDFQLTNASGTSWTGTDVFTVNTTNVWYNATIEAIDDAGAVTTQEENQYILDSAPTVTINSPSNSTVFDYDQTWSISVSDNDDVPGENNTATVALDGIDLDYVWGTDSFTESSGFRAELGTHNLSVNVSDPQGNTDSDWVIFTVDNFQILSNTTDSTVYETENTTYTIEVQKGDMVEDLHTRLYWNGTIVDTLNWENGGSVENITRNHYFQPPLVQNNASVYDWKFEIEANYTDFNNSSYQQETTNTTPGNQTINWAYYNPQLNITQTRVIEKQNINSILKFTNQLPTLNADNTTYHVFNETTKTGSKTIFTTPLIGKANTTKTVTGTLQLEFKNSERNITASNDSVNIYRKILTDCNTKELGVLGDKALTLTLYNEENTSQKLSGNFNFNFDTTYLGKHSRNYGFTDSNTETTDICIYPAWTSYKLTGPINYDKNNYNERTFNYFEKQVTNTTFNQSLYLLKETQSTLVYYTVKNANGAVPGITIEIQRYYPGTNSYESVAKPETDSEGVAASYQEASTTEYRYILRNNNEIVLETEKQTLFCDTIPCEKVFRLDSGTSGGGGSGVDTISRTVNFSSELVEAPKGVTTSSSFQAESNYLNNVTLSVSTGNCPRVDLESNSLEVRPGTNSYGFNVTPLPRDQIGDIVECNVDISAQGINVDTLVLKAEVLRGDTFLDKVVDGLGSLYNKQFICLTGNLEEAQNFGETGECSGNTLELPFPTGKGFAALLFIGGGLYIARTL